MAEIKKYEEEKTKKPKALTCIHAALSDAIFSRIMTCETAKQAWDKLNEEFEGSDRVKIVKLLTLKREFEMFKMKEFESIKDYSTKVMELVNQMRLFGEDLIDQKVVKKIMISVTDKFKAKIAPIEESCDLKTLLIFKLISKLDVHE